MTARKKAERPQAAGEEVQGSAAEASGDEMIAVVCPQGVVNLGGAKYAAGERFEMPLKDAADQLARGVLLDADEYDRRVAAAEADLREHPQGASDED